MISARIHGVPCSPFKVRGDRAAPTRWKEAVIDQTKHLEPVTAACLLKITFLLPPGSFPGDFPHGPDLDNLLKGTMDALEKTIFRNTRGGDSCVVALIAVKTRVEPPEEAGAHLEVLSVSIT